MSQTLGANLGRLAENNTSVVFPAWKWKMSQTIIAFWNWTNYLQTEGSARAAAMKHLSCSTTRVTTVEHLHSQKIGVLAVADEKASK